MGSRALAGRRSRDASSIHRIVQRIVSCSGRAQRLRNACRRTTALPASTRKAAREASPGQNETLSPVLVTTLALDRFRCQGILKALFDESCRRRICIYAAVLDLLSQCRQAERRGCEGAKEAVFKAIQEWISSMRTPGCGDELAACKTLAKQAPAAPGTYLAARPAIPRFRIWERGAHTSAASHRCPAL